jgi:hypothetical protein
MGVGQPGSHLLKLFAAHVRQAFGHHPYQVGSSLTEKRGWRDVDVRLILPDDEYEKLFGPKRGPHDHALDTHLDVGMMNWAWSEAGKRLTGLPIDFQIQSMTDANTDPANEGPRSALIFMPDEFSTGTWVT